MLTTQRSVHSVLSCCLSHCPRHPFLLALLPACAGSRGIMRQDCSAYAKEPLRTVGLLEAAHQYRVQDIHGSVSATTHTQPPTKR